MFLLFLFSESKFSVLMVLDKDPLTNRFQTFGGGVPKDTQR